MKKTSFVIGAFLTALAPDDSRAQDNDPDTIGVTIAPVSITATRQRTSIFNAPLAVSIVGRNQLETKRGYSLDEAVSEIPGVFARSRYGASDISLTIRGFGARGAGDRSNAGTSRGVRVLIDGIPETEPDGRTSFDLVDLATANRIEVVRSNASALWGNAGGGVVDISTTPEFSRDFGSAQQIVGSYGLFRTTLQAGTRMGAASLAATFTNTTQAGYRDHSDNRRALLNASITAPLGNDTDLGVYIAAANNLLHVPGPLTLEQITSDPQQANATYAARDERRWNRVGRVGVTLRHALTGESSVSGMAYVNPKVLQRSERGTFRDFNRYHLGGNLVYRTAYEINSELSANTIVGADRDYQNGTILFYSLSSTGTRGTELRDNKGEGATNTGVFAQQEFRAGRLGLDLGARWDEIRYDYRNFINPKLNDAKEFSRVSPKIGVNFRVSATHSFYANIGGGVEAPAGNETDPASTFGQDTVTALNPLLEPIRSTTYEVGTKRLITLSGGILSAISYEAALYNTNVTNEIVPYRGGRFYFTAGKVQRRGAEIGAALLGAQDLEITSSLTVSRNRYVDYSVDSVHYGRPGRSADYAGNDVAGIPGIFYAVSASRSVSDAVPVRVQLGVRGVGDYFVDDANNVTVPAHHTFNATISIANGISAGRFLLKPFLSIENIADKRYIGSAFINPDFVNGVPVAFEPGARRTFIFSLSVGPGGR